LPSPADPVAFTILGVGVRWYALFILTGILAAVWLIRVLARRRGLNPDFPLDNAPWIVVAGIVGARLYYLLLQWDEYVANPERALNVRLGGLTIHGAIVGGSLALWILCRRADQPFLRWADLIVPGVALGQAIGRWGNWANQEAFGLPTDLPWGVAIDPGRRPAASPEAAFYHPTFLYESLFNLANAALLSWVVLRVPGSRSLRDGDVLWSYCLLYGSARLLIERIRTDSLYIGPLPAAYWVSIALIALGGGMLLVRHVRWPLAGANDGAGPTGRGARPS
jgi:phosphatidylglycerol:prolipoprotein diacylglycerol transferase